MRFGNNHEGSIPFTRSIDFRALANKCSKNAVNVPFAMLRDVAFLATVSAQRSADGFCG